MAWPLDLPEIIQTEATSATTGKGQDSVSQEEEKDTERETAPFDSSCAA